MHIRGSVLRQPAVPAAHDARRPRRRRRRHHLLRRPRPRRGRPLMARLHRRQRDRWPRRSSAATRGPVGDDPAAAPRPGAGRLRHRRRHGATSASSSGPRRPRCSAPATFYEMFKFEPVGTYLLNICKTMSCALLGRRRADAPRRADARHQGRQHHRRRPVHAASTPSARRRAPRPRRCRSTTATASGSPTRRFDELIDDLARRRSTTRSRRTARWPRCASASPPTAASAPCRPKLSPAHRCGSPRCRRGGRAT